MTDNTKKDHKLLKVKRDPNAKMKPYYVDKKKFYEAIVKYKQDCAIALAEGKPKPRIPEYCGDCLVKIATGLSYHLSFINYSFRQEMISDAIENTVLYFDNFNSEKYTNPFGYFTEISKWAFIRRIAKEEKIRYTTYKYFDATMMGTELADLLVDEHNNLAHEPMYDNIQDFIARYEEKDRIKREKKKEALASKGLLRFLDEENLDNDTKEV